MVTAMSDCYLGVVSQLMIREESAALQPHPASRYIVSEKVAPRAPLDQGAGLSGDRVSPRGLGRLPWQGLRTANAPAGSAVRLRPGADRPDADRGSPGGFEAEKRALKWVVELAGVTHAHGG